MRSWSRSLTFVLFATLAAEVSAQPSTSSAPPSKFDLESIDSYINSQVREKGYPGLSVTIVKDGKIVFAKGYGRISIETDSPILPDTMFAAGSVTKQFTCACVLLLAEDGKLSVDDKVAKYFPNLTRANDITLYDLMTHTSGYPDYYPLDFVDRRLLKPIAVDALLSEYAGGKLDFEPGTRWSYSNTGYVLLGRVIEKVTGEPFGTFLEHRILRPLGMSHSAFEPAASVEGHARGHLSILLGSAQLATREADGWLHAAGGLSASGPDLASWDLALLEEKLLSPSSFRFMTTPRRLANGKPTDYGCGMHVGQMAGETVLTHGGAVSGFLSMNALVPRTKSAVILLTNGEHVNASGLHSTILGLLLRDQVQPPSPGVPKIAGLPAKEAALEFLHQLQAGEIDRKALGEEFSIYLSDERLQAGALRLKELGEPESVIVTGSSERGGMEVAHIRFTFKGTVLTTSMYRSPDGKIQQLLFTKP
jgi:D-alanyl-D-alanine carboxypeptidase